MKNIAIFYHCLVHLGSNDDLLMQAFNIIHDQMFEARRVGLFEAAKEIHIGMNGGPESLEILRLLLPHKARIVQHGLQCRNECRTILMLEQWLPGHGDWNVFYFHAKGATRPLNDGFTGTWRACMMRHVVTNWKRCVSDLESGYDAVGCHWMEPPATPPGQHIFAGNFWAARASFLSTLPSIMKRDRIHVSGIDSKESRYESEVWLGNGPRKPRVKDYHGPHWNPSKIDTCR